MEMSKMEFVSPFPLNDLIRLEVVLEHKLKTLSFHRVYFPISRTVSLLKKDMEYSLKASASLQDWYLKSKSVLDSDTMKTVQAKPNDKIFVKLKNSFED